MQLGFKVSLQSVIGDGKPNELADQESDVLIYNASVPEWDQSSFDEGNGEGSGQGFGQGFGKGFDQERDQSVPEHDQDF